MTQWWWGVVAALGALVAPGDQDPMCSVLGGLDLTRTRALTTERPALLAGVYLSDALRERDERLLASYAGRGLRLEGAAMERRSCRRVREPGPDVRLVVTDVLGPTWAVDRTGERRRLPQDRPTRRVVTLSPTADGWRVSRVE